MSTTPNIPCISDAGVEAIRGLWLDSIALKADLETERRIVLVTRSASVLLDAQTNDEQWIVAAMVGRVAWQEGSNA